MIAFIKFILSVLRALIALALFVAGVYLAGSSVVALQAGPGLLDIIWYTVWVAIGIVVLAGSLAIGLGGRRSHYARCTTPPPLHGSNERYDYTMDEVVMKTHPVVRAPRMTQAEYEQLLEERGILPPRLHVPQIPRDAEPGYAVHGGTVVQEPTSPPIPERPARPAPAPAQPETKQPSYRANPWGNGEWLELPSKEF